MSFIFKTLAKMLLVLYVTNVYADNRAKSVAVGRGETSVRSETPAQGAVTIRGSARVFTPLPPEEVEKLGREGVKRKMMEQKY